MGLTLVRVGSDARPATKEDIKEIEEKVNQLLKSTDKDKVLVTHHCVDVTYIPTS